MTDIDFCVETPSVVVCAEAKFSEDGLGRCSCGVGNAAVADCAERVLQRVRYWRVAEEILYLPPRKKGSPCPISAGYQAIRNVAAATALAEQGDGAGAFVLFFDERNPYFRPTGEWPGWPEALRQTLQTADSNNLLRFRAYSWQELVERLPLPGGVRDWARTKHRL